MLAWVGNRSRLALRLQFRIGTAEDTDSAVPSWLEVLWLIGKIEVVIFVLVILIVIVEVAEARS